MPRMNAHRQLSPSTAKTDESSKRIRCERLRLRCRRPGSASDLPSDNELGPFIHQARLFPSHRQGPPCRPVRHVTYVDGLNCYPCSRSGPGYPPTPTFPHKGGGSNRRPHQIQRLRRLALSGLAPRSEVTAPLRRFICRRRILLLDSSVLAVDGRSSQTSPS